VCLGEDLVRMASETVQPAHVTFCCGPITTLNPSHNVATPEPSRWYNCNILYKMLERAAAWHR
jgi:hypothetical protein